VVEGERALRNSDALLAIYGELGWPWRAAEVFRAFQGWHEPRLRLVARNRYRLFGPPETCWVPSKTDRERVL
jgi:predicted DCC family thiol-disulfide oxidoreductase YuxK